MTAAYTSPVHLAKLAANYSVLSSHNMPKATLEFTPLGSFSAELLTPGIKDGAKIQVLSHDKETGDRTFVLMHPRGQEWGADETAEGKTKQASHEYWEEAYVLKGRLFDKSLKQWFSANSYCCRHPHMQHGPWIADSEEGCQELVFTHYTKLGNAWS
ncbi:hypothetical protein AcW2_007381 [Taiwanofungus camphoratus]|nr:hypothetical protein AcW2_007381 [Antrodia cinnamomea]